MGKVKSEKDESGNVVMTQVAGYRNMDDEESNIYKPGDEVSYEEVPGMFKDKKGSWGNYYSAKGYKAIYLEAVREVVTDDFEVNKVVYEAAHSEARPELREGLPQTSAGITKKLEYQNDGRTCVITYTIPENYEGNTVDVDATKDVMEAYNTIEDTRFGYNGTQPGDTLGPVYIKIANSSGKKFSYAEGSFILQSPGHDGEAPYIGDIRTFDGVIPPEASVPSRVGNGALRYLYNMETDPRSEDLQDDVLGGKLKEKGYEGGVADLHQYYLDYYNNFFGEKYKTTWSNLYEVPYGLLVQRDEGIFGGQSSESGLKETNPEVAGVGYSYMYTRLMSVAPGNEEGLKDGDGVYAVGNYMKGDVSYDGNAKAAWGSLEPGAAGSLAGMSLFINGETNDFYQNTAWGIEVGFRLKEVPKPPEEPKDPDDPETPPTTPPGGGGNGGGGGGGGGRTPRTTTTIDTPEVPLADLPAEPVTELIEEEDVPLAALPKTGDSRHSGMLLMMFGMAGIGMILSAAGLRRRKEDKE
ncbi:LPXTG cell wall anchor domain-containing protein [Clostridiaceae bacterium]|nr:LPXTG cell wall anchor domain-containing protein [Clostridiaceae bacterium]RKI17551.1 LPXTG cell wall anchor domain-containing protein [bacterium 1XD21-70]